MFLLPLSETETLAEVAREKEHQTVAKSQVAGIQENEHTLGVEQDPNVLTVVPSTEEPEEEASGLLEKQRKEKAELSKHEDGDTNEGSSLTKHNPEVGKVIANETQVRNEDDSLLEEEGQAEKRDNSEEKEDDETEQPKKKTPSNTDAPNTQQDEVKVATRAKKKGGKSKKGTPNKGGKKKVVKEKVVKKKVVKKNAVKKPDETVKGTTGAKRSSKRGK